MAFETNKFCVVKKKTIEKSTFNVECNVTNEVEIDKILSVKHSAYIENLEILNGVANFSGNIELCVLFSTIDGEIGNINCACPFTSKIENGEIAVGDKMSVTVDVDDYSIDNISNSVIKINCACTQSGEIFCLRDMNKISTNDENMCIKEDEMKIWTFVGESKQVFTVASEYSIKEPIKKIVMTESCANVKNVECGENFVAVNGEVITRLLYLTEKERFETAYLTENFKQEVEVDGVTKDSVAHVQLCVKNCLVKCDVDADDKGVTVKLTIPVEAKVLAFAEKSEIVIKDIYCLTNELEVSTESFEMTKFCQMEEFEAKIDGTLTLDDDKPRVDKIMFVGGSNMNITNAYAKGEEIFVEGVVKTNVVYLNDETNSLHSVVVEVPFVVSDKTSATDDAQVKVFATLYDVDVVVKKGREFYFDAKLKIQIQFCEDEVEAVISNINLAGAYPEKDYAIEVVFADAGDTAWKIAKMVKVPQESIMLQNPNLSFPLEKDENIVVYYQKR